jgi:hypothetical protein
MTVNDIYQLIKFIIKKNQNGDISPAEFNRIINVAQDSFTSFLIGEYQSYQYGRPQSRVSYGQNQDVRQKLTPIIYGTRLSVDAFGFAPYPADYLHTDAMWSIYGRQRIRYTPQNALDAHVNSVIDPVADNPVYIIEKGGFRYFPNSIGQADLNYVQKPPTIVWASVYGANQRPVYDPSNSVDPVWDSIDVMEIVARALRMVGVNLQAADVSAYANEIKNAGQ